MHPAERDLDAEHAGGVPLRVRPLGQVGRVLDRPVGLAVVTVAVVVPLAVGATPEAGLGEDALIDLALLAKLDLRLEEVDLVRQVGRHLIEKPGFPVLRAQTVLQSRSRFRGVKKYHEVHWITLF